MPSEKILASKQQNVAELTEAMKGAACYVFVSTRGLTVVEGYDYEIIEKMYRPHDNLSILVTL